MSTATYICSIREQTFASLDVLTLISFPIMRDLNVQSNVLKTTILAISILRVRGYHKCHQWCGLLRRRRCQSAYVIIMVFSVWLAKMFSYVKEVNNPDWLRSKNDALLTNMLSNKKIISPSESIGSTSDEGWAALPDVDPQQRGSWRGAGPTG